MFVKSIDLVENCSILFNILSAILFSFLSTVFFDIVHNVVSILFDIVCNVVQNIFTQIYVSIVHDIASHCSILLNTWFKVLRKSTYAGFSTNVSVLSQGALQNSHFAALPGSIVAHASSGQFLCSLLSDRSDSCFVLRSQMSGLYFCPSVFHVSPPKGAFPPDPLSFSPHDISKFRVYLETPSIV